MVRMKLASRPTDLPSLQACAAIGQMGLIHTWSSVLENHSIRTAQVLLTHDDLADRRRYLNSCDALQNLIDWRVIRSLMKTILYLPMRFVLVITIH